MGKIPAGRRPGPPPPSPQRSVATHPAATPTPEVGAAYHTATPPPVAGIRPSHHHINAGGRSCPSLTPSAGWPSRLRTRRLLQSSTHPAWSEVSLTFYVRIHHYFHCRYWSVSSFFNFFTETESSFCSFCVSFAPAGLSAAGPIRTGRGRGAALQDLIRAGGADRDADGPEARCAVAGPEAPLSLSFLSVCYYH